MKAGLYLTTQYPPGSDMISAFQEQVALVHAARDRGWDAVATGQHYLSEGMVQLQLVPFLSRMAAEAGPMAGIAGVLLLALHNPVEVAEQIASLDVLWKGNFILGVGLGYRKEEFAAFGVPWEARIRRFEETLALVKRLWTEDSVTAQVGACRLEKITMTSRPVQRPHPPIWIPGSGSMETIRFVAERRYPWIALPYSQFDVMKEHFDMLREYAASHCGYDVPPAQIGWPAMIYVGETDRKAREEFEPHFWYLARKGLRLPREYMFPPGHTSVESQLRPSHVKRKFISLLSSWQEAEEGTYAIVGSAETVRQRLREGIKAAGCGIIQGIFQVGSMPHEMAMASMERFARDVMPALRAEFP